MQQSLYLLIAIGILDGFLMRPLHQFVMAKGFRLVKKAKQKNTAITLMIASMLSGMAVTLGSIYLSLDLPGFMPLQKEQLGFFIVPFLVGGVFWILYARKFNKACPIDFD